MVRRLAVHPLSASVTGAAAILQRLEEQGEAAALPGKLVAISREGELVCFSIYPLSASAAIKALFREHDVAFAAALGVPLHRETPDGKGYRIDLVIASEWWDDGLDDAAMDSDSPARTSADHKASR